MTGPIRKTTAYVLTLMAVRMGLSLGATTDCLGQLRLSVPGLVERWAEMEQTMRHDDPAIQHALTILGQAVNPIRVADAEEIRRIYARTPSGAPPAGLNAFRAPGDVTDPNIYVNKDSLVYRKAVQKPSAFTMLKLAAILAHEQVHNTDRDFAA